MKKLLIVLLILVGVQSAQGWCRGCGGWYGGRGWYGGYGWGYPYANMLYPFSVAATTAALTDRPRTIVIEQAAQPAKTKDVKARAKVERLSDEIEELEEQIADLRAQVRSLKAVAVR